MKKSINLLLLSALLTTAINAQISGSDIDQMKNKRVADKEMETNGYKLPSGWIWHIGDTLHLGRGTLPTRNYAFIYESLISWSNTMGGNKYGNDAMNGKKSLKSHQAAQAIIKSFNVSGTKRGGYTAIAVVGLGSIANYWIEIENAVDAGEVKSPKEYRTADSSSDQPVVQTKADKLRDLKKLLDDGILTQDEFDSEKQKILDSK